MTAEGLPYARCERLQQRDEFARWVLSRLRGGIGDWAWSTWTFKNMGPAGDTWRRNRVGVRTARRECDRIASLLTAPAGAGAAFVAVEGWTKGGSDGSPRHHLHALSKADASALADLERRWRERWGHVLVRHLSEADAAAQLAEYVSKDATKAAGYFAVGGKAWLT